MPLFRYEWWMKVKMHSEFEAKDRDEAEDMIEERNEKYLEGCVFDYEEEGTTDKNFVPMGCGRLIRLKEKTNA